MPPSQPGLSFGGVKYQDLGSVETLPEDSDAASPEAATPPTKHDHAKAKIINFFMSSTPCYYGVSMTWMTCVYARLCFVLLWYFSII
jgi:hypothetical protein